MVISWGCDIPETVGNFSDILLTELGKETIVFPAKAKLRKYSLNLPSTTGSAGSSFDDRSCPIRIHLAYSSCGKYVNGQLMTMHVSFSSHTFRIVEGSASDAPSYLKIASAMVVLGVTSSVFPRIQ